MNLSFLRATCLNEWLSAACTIGLDVVIQTNSAEVEGGIKGMDPVQLTLSILYTAQAPLAPVHTTYPSTAHSMCTFRSMHWTTCQRLYCMQPLHNTAFVDVSPPSPLFLFPSFINACHASGVIPQLSQVFHVSFTWFKVNRWSCRSFRLYVRHHDELNRYQFLFVCYITFLYY